MGGARFGTAYFGNFLKSLYTLFQVLTGDSWSEAIGRPLMAYTPTSGIYFVSFILLTPIILINVVVAVLLEKMVSEEEEEESDDESDGEAPNEDDDATSAVATRAEGEAAFGGADAGGADAGGEPLPTSVKPPSHGSSARKPVDFEHEFPKRLRGLEDQMKSIRGMLNELLEADGLTYAPPPPRTH